MDWGLPRDDELTDVVADHLGLDLDVLEFLSIVYTDCLPYELGDDREVLAVCPHGGSLLCVLQVVEEELLLVVQTAGECSP